MMTIITSSAHRYHYSRQQWK